MDLRALQSSQLLAAAAVVAASMVLALQFVNPSPVVVSLTENGSETTEIGGFFTYGDTFLVALAGFVAGGASVYLTLDTPGRGPEESRSATPEPAPQAEPGPDGATPSETLLERRREEWTETADRLGDTEGAIYEAVLEADGVLAQSEVVERTDFSKATVSRALDSLETKDLVERKRRGMGNVVLLL
jgi:uncharacterized membrane protein